MKIKATLASLITVAAMYGATAGDWCAPSTDAKCPVECAPEPLGFTFDSGYDSQYYFRGLWFSSNNLWAGISYTKPICDQWSYTLGALYTHDTSTHLPGGALDYAELDLFATLTYDAKIAKFALAYMNYNYFNTYSGSIGGVTNGNAHPDSQLRDARDVCLTVTVPIGGMNIYGMYVYDPRVGGHYAEGGGDYAIAVSDRLSIVPSVQIGYNISQYYTFAPFVPGAVNSGWNHIRPMITAPMKLSDSWTFTPYAAVNISLDAREALNDFPGGPGANDFYTGAKLSFSF